MDIFRNLGRVLDPTMGAHIAHAMEVSSVFNRNGRGSDVPDENPLLKDLDSLRGRDGPINLSACDQSAGGYDAFDHGVLAYN